MGATESEMGNFGDVPLQLPVFLQKPAPIPTPPCATLRSKLSSHVSNIHLNLPRIQQPKLTLLIINLILSAIAKNFE